MKSKIPFHKSWEITLGLENSLSEIDENLQAQNYMPENPPTTQTTQPTRSETEQGGPTRAKEKLQNKSLVVRSELNLEQNSIFTVSTYRRKSREVMVREIAPTGEVAEHKAIIGKTAGGIETGILTTYHFKVYLALLELWENEGKSLSDPVHFTTLRIMKRLGMKDSGEEYRRLKRWLRDLRQIPITFINSFYIPEVSRHTNLADLTVLSYLNIYERNRVGRQQKTRGYGEFRFDDHILSNLINNHTHPLRLDVINSFRRRKDMAILLYTYIDRNLAFRMKYEIGLEKLFEYLDLSQRQVRYPSDRKAKIEPVLTELRGKALSTGTLSYCRIHRTENNEDYKLVCRKKPFARELKQKKASPQLASKSEPQPEKPEFELLSSLVQKGLTDKQADKLLSEKGEEVVRNQLAYLPHRLEEYKAQGREVKEAAIFYDSIRDNWQPPRGYFEVEKEKEKEAKLRDLDQEYKERVEQAKVKAEEWALRPAEDRITAPLDSWVWSEKQFYHREPSEEDIEVKKKELIANLQTKEEYEQYLIDEIERDIQNKRHKIVR